MPPSPDETAREEDEFLARIMDACNCCRECCSEPCPGVRQGGFCDNACDCAEYDYDSLNEDDYE